MSKLVIDYKSDVILRLDKDEYHELRSLLRGIAEILDQTDIEFRSHGNVIVTHGESEGTIGYIDPRIYGDTIKKVKKKRNV